MTQSQYNRTARGTRQAEYLRISLALRDLKELGLQLAELHQDALPLLVDKAIDYLNERKLKLSPRSY